jgi:type IV pilus assembly protein PilX
MTNCKDSGMTIIQRQHGATLLVALIILLVLTILGLSSSQSVLLQERMTFSVQDSHVALQSAELAASEAEAFIAANVTTKSGFADDGDGSVKGLFTQGNGPANLFEASNWTNANSQQASTSVHANVPAPRFIIEDLGLSSDEADDAGSVNMMGYGQSSGQGEINSFRIIAQGKGRADETKRYVISYYGKRL